MKITALWSNFIVVLMVLVIYWLNPNLIETIENQSYDLRLVAQGEETPNDVAIAAIDEKSLREYGRWPWPRDRVAALVDQLNSLGAAVVVLDILFSEPENREWIELIEQLKSRSDNEDGQAAYDQILTALHGDYVLQDSLQRNDNVVLSLAFVPASEAEGIDKTQEQAAIDSIRDDSIQHIKLVGDATLNTPLFEHHGLIVNLPELERAARYTGHIVFPPDEDGTVRRTPFVHKYRDLFIPSADIQAVRLYHDVKPALRINLYGIEALELGDVSIPTDESGRALINFYGPEQTVPTYSVKDVFDAELPEDALSGKIVIVGATAAGINDLRVTPYNASFPGVEMRASVIQNLLDDSFLHRPDWMSVIDMLLIVVLGGFLSWWLPRHSFYVSVASSLGIIMVYIGVGIYLFNAAGWWVNLTYPSLLVLMLFMTTTIIQYFTTEKEKRNIKGAFKQYVPEKVVDNVVEHMDSLKLGGDIKELTVLFSDIRNFTSKSEALDAHTLVPLLNKYLNSMTDTVFEHDGTLDKYIGDAIMAIYGAPVHHTQHTYLACQTAVRMMEGLQALQKDWYELGFEDGIDIGIGINTGPMIVGNMGSERRFDYTVIGDSVNLGARLESLNKEYGTHILISEYTYIHVRDQFPHTREIDRRTVKGKQQSVAVYEIMLDMHYPVLNRDFIGEYHKAYRIWRDGDKQAAVAAFQDLVDRYDDPVSASHIRRITDRRKQTY